MVYSCFFGDVACASACVSFLVEYFSCSGFDAFFGGYVIGVAHCLLISEAKVR